MFASGAAFADFWDGMDAYNAGKFTEALSEFQPLADRGKAEAQLMVALLHHYGKGIPVNMAAANAWYRKSATGGNATAQWSLGLAYAHARGLPKDVVLAHFLYHLGKDGGDEDADYNYSDIAKKMTAEQIAESETLYKLWKVGKPIPEASQTGRK